MIASMQEQFTDQFGIVWQKVGHYSGHASNYSEQERKRREAQLTPKPHPQWFVDGCKRLGFGLFVRHRK